MFAGEGDAFRTNRRFKFLSEHSDAKRLSTAFDSVTLYGRDPATPPDIYGKVGTSGVSIATLEDMKALYDGFDLCSPTTSVSMTINGPAPTILAYFLNTAIDQQVDNFAEEHGREPDADEREQHRRVRPGERPRDGAGRHPQGGPGPEHLHLLHRVQPTDDGRHPGMVHRAQGPQLLLGVDLRLPHRRGRGEPHQPARVHPRQRVHLRRGLPRARHGDRRLRAQPVVLLLQRHGRRVHRDRPGRPADLGGRHARPLRRERAVQKLKYHVQTSGRSLHAQEMDFNDIRTTLQALCALYDNANSLHTNAYDEAVTTPDRRVGPPGLAIQLIINREWGLAMNENPLQGSFIVDELTDLVEEAVLAEFDRISRARRRARRDGDRLPARPHPGRVDALRAPQARRHAADHRRQHLHPARQRGLAHRVRARAGDRGGEAGPARPARRLPRPPRREAPAALAAAGGRDRRTATCSTSSWAPRGCARSGRSPSAFFEVGGQYRRNV